MTTAQTTVSVEVSVASPTGAPSPSLFSATARPSPTTVRELHADPGQLERAATELARLGFRVLATSRLSVSVECTPALFTETFGTELAQRDVETVGQAHARPSAMSFLAPATGAPWAPPPSLAGLVERAHVQPPYLFMENYFPPRVREHHLRVPGDVAAMLRASAVHRQGFTGRGVTVAMIDSGFHIEHPYYLAQGYSMSRTLAPDATNVEEDEEGHGSAEAANILAVAPDVTFVGVKAGPNLAAAVKATAALRPDVISVSLGFDLRNDQTGMPMTAVPGNLKVLEAEVTDAVADGITVVFSSGNGHISFPGMHPDVISAGGAFIDETGAVQASDYASAFPSAIYPGRSCPDVTGLVGMRPNADYIMLPLPPGCDIDRDVSAHDGTGPGDGWSVISGTSAAAPQLAGVVALLKQKNPGLSPAEVKAALTATARDVSKGHANTTANPVPNHPEGVPIPAGAGPDGATGHGLVDAFAAWKHV